MCYNSGRAIDGTMLSLQHTHPPLWLTLVIASCIVDKKGGSPQKKKRTVPSSEAAEGTAEKPKRLEPHQQHDLVRRMEVIRR